MTEAETAARVVGGKEGADVGGLAGGEALLGSGQRGDSSVRSPDVRNPDARSPDDRNPGARHLSVRHLGRISYADAHALQQELVTERQAEQVGDTVLFVEHPPTVTMGRAVRDRRHFVATPEMLASMGVWVEEVGRGGDVTYHGPGQLVVYPILMLEGADRDVRRYVRRLEEAMVEVCASFGVQASRKEGLQGAWVQDNKIGAVGVRISRWVTMHGFALNVSTDLSAFGWIVPCGIADKGVTSLERELGEAPPWQKVVDRTEQALAEGFGFEGITRHD